MMLWSALANWRGWAADAFSSGRMGRGGRGSSGGVGFLGGMHSIETWGIWGFDLLVAGPRPSPGGALLVGLVGPLFGPVDPLGAGAPLRG